MCQRNEVSVCTTREWIHKIDPPAAKNVLIYEPEKSNNYPGRKQIDI